MRQYTSNREEFLPRRHEDHEGEEIHGCVNSHSMKSAFATKEHKDRKEKLMKLMRLGPHVTFPNSFVNSHIVEKVSGRECDGLAKTGKRKKVEEFVFFVNLAPSR